MDLWPLVSHAVGDFSARANHMSSPPRKGARKSRSVCGIRAFGQAKHMTLAQLSARNQPARRGSTQADRSTSILRLWVRQQINDPSVRKITGHTSLCNSSPGDEGPQPKSTTYLRVENQLSMSLRT